jgi:class 3 adenylate cyclase
VGAANVERRLAAIMFTDIVGYTALMAESEEKGLRVRERHRALVRPLVERYHGAWIQDVGDETLSCFPSAVDAVNCAFAIQGALKDDSQLRVRVGIHVGDVVFEEGSVHGDGVNVASRIRPLAEPGSICISDEVQHAIQNQANVETRPLGEHALKNVSRPVAVFAVIGTPAPPRPVSVATPERRRRLGLRTAQVLGALILVAVGAWWLSRFPPELPPIRSIAVLPLENLSGDPEQEYFADGMTEALIGAGRGSYPHYRAAH